MENGNKYRRKMLEAAVKGNRGHLGGSFSCIEILMAIHNVMGKNDEFILSKGHSAIALYSLLFDDLELFLKDGSYLTEHPSALIPGIRVTTGSLGHGIGLAAGIAMAKKLDNEPGRVYVLVGDGECMEGSVYEAMMFASIQHLTNLTVILDLNKVMSTQNLPKIDYGKIFREMLIVVHDVDGHNVEDMITELRSPFRTTYTWPSLIVAHTIKGKGVSFMENKHEWHNGVPNGEQLEIARKELAND